MMLTNDQMTEKTRYTICGEVLGGSYYTGTVVCIRPENHSGEHDGGELEKQLGEGLAIQHMQDAWEHDPVY